MIARPGALLGRGRAGAGLPPGGFIGPGVLLAPASFERDHTPDGSVAYALSPVVDAFSGYAENVPRFWGPERWLRIDEPHANLVPNARGEGAVQGVVGGGGAFPSGGWQVVGGVPGWLTAEVVDSGIDVVGVPWLSVRWAAASPAATGWQFAFSANIAVTANPYVGAAYAHLAGGALPTGPVTLNHPGFGSSVIVPSANFDRFARTFTAAVGNTRTQIGHSCEVGVPFDFTIWYAAPQLGLARWTEAPLLPPVGNAVSPLRGAERVSASLDALGFAPDRLGVVEVVASVLDATLWPARRVWLQIDDGTANNRVTVFCGASSLALSYEVVTGGVVAAGVLGASMAAMVERRLRVEIAAGGVVSFVVDGGAPIVPGQAANNWLLTSLRVGNHHDLLAPACGFIVTAAALPVPAPSGSLVVPGAVRAPATFTRAQAPGGTLASVVGPNGVNRLDFAANVPRFQGAERRLLLEPERVNRTTQPMGGGGWLTFGAAPAAVITLNALADLSGGVTMARFLFSGQTPGVAQVIRIPCTGLVPGALYAVSFDCRLAVDGCGPGITVDVGDGSNSPTIKPQMTVGVTSRITVVPPVAGVGSWIDITFFGLIGGATDLDVYIGAVQVEAVVGTEAVSSFIEGAAGVLTRGIDLPVVSLAAAGVNPANGCRVLLVAQFPATNPGVDRCHFSLDDGSADNAVVVQQNAGQGQTRGWVALGGVLSFPWAAGNLGVAEFTITLDLFGDGTGRIQVSGFGPVDFSGVPIGLLTTARLGHRFGDQASFDGEVRSWRVIPF